MPTNYKPSISSLIPFSELPQIPGLTGNLSTIFSKLYYANLKVHKSANGDAGYYSMNLQLNQNGEFGIPFGDFNVAINKNSGGFAFTLEYKWIILKYLRGFSIDNIPTDAKDYVDILLKVTGINDKQLLYAAIDAFYLDAEDPLLAFLQDVKDNFSGYGSITLTGTTTEQIIDNLISDLQAANTSNSIPLLITTTCVVGGINFEETFEKVQLLFSGVMGTFSADNLLEILTPQFKASFGINELSLEFPRNILTPYNEENENAKSALVAIGNISMSYGNKLGFEFDFDENVTFEFPKSYISKTGFTVEFSGAKVDLSKTKNIPEADADGRSVEFNGVFVQDATIGLPDEWTRSASSGAIIIKGTDLLIGTEGGLSGIIGIQGHDVLEIDLFGLTITFDTFSATFSKNSLVDSDITGTLVIAGLIDKNTDEDAELSFSMSWDGDGYEIIISSEDENGILLGVGSQMDITLKELKLAKKDGKWEFGSKGKIERLSTLGKLDAIIPEAINIEELLLMQEGDNNYDITFTWPNDVNATLTDEEGFFVEIPLDKKILDAFTLHLLKVKIKEAQDNGISITTTVNASLELGPITGSVTGAGIETTVSFPNGGGNLGPMQVDLSFVSPTGVGIGIKNDFITGAGYFSYDKEKSTYSGALEVELFDYKFKAIGILSTKMPDGSDGYSILIILTGEFNPPFELGYGFTLNAIGGMVGLNRTSNVDVLRAGVIDNSLANILFPTDIAKNGEKIIQDISAAFPVKKGRFLIGPMAKIGWGKPNVIVGDVALVVELPAPVSLHLLGVIRAVLPDGDEPMLKLQVNFLGTLDLGKKQLSFDAFIYESYFLAFAITGSVALRLYWGQNANFLYSVGGFHPAYTPPPMNLLPMSRIGMGFSSSNASMALQSYFAITTNSVQFGSSLQAKASISKFSAEGGAGFDALFMFAPFSFVANIWANVCIKAWDTTLFNLGANITLSGPNPWQAYGSVKFEVLWIDYEIDFDITLSSGAKPELKYYALKELLEGALKDKANWSVTPPSKNLAQVSVVDNKNDSFIVHPFGSIRFSQKLIPLNTTVQKYGNGKVWKNNPGDEHVHVSFGNITDGTNTLSKKTPTELFPRGEFFYLNSSDRLSSTGAYINLPSGVEISGASDLEFYYGNRKRIVFNELAFDRGKRSENGVVEISPDILDRHNIGATVRNMSFSAQTNQKPTHGPEIIEEKPHGYAVLSKTNLTNINGTVVFNNIWDAEQYQKEYYQTNPIQRDTTLILHTSEIE